MLVLRLFRCVARGLFRHRFFRFLFRIRFRSRFLSPLRFLEEQVCVGRVFLERIARVEHPADGFREHGVVVFLVGQIGADLRPFAVVHLLAQAGHLVNVRYVRPRHKGVLVHIRQHGRFGLRYLAALHGLAYLLLHQCPLRFHAQLLLLHATCLGFLPLLLLIGQLLFMRTTLPRLLLQLLRLDFLK